MKAYVSQSQTPNTNRLLKVLFGKVYILRLSKKKCTKLQMCPRLYDRWRTGIETENGTQALDGGQNASGIDPVSRMIGTGFEKVFCQAEKSDISKNRDL